MGTIVKDIVPKAVVLNTLFLLRLAFHHLCDCIAKFTLEKIYANKVGKKKYHDVLNNGKTTCNNRLIVQLLVDRVRKLPGK